ncbi:MAG: sensor domain-containing diguanylate cyclase [Proteobacteria bacterium]|nr:sensor domain-containing diguanylate cyclase [Pseudomonadota bacterium]
MLKNILVWANQFVPSESGSILFDDPTVKHGKDRSNLLYFVACFGKGSTKLVGTAIPAETGIVGKVYASGKPYISKKAKEDVNFYAAIDKKTQFETKSIICAPIRINKVAIGVIELINRLDQIDYNNDDLTLLKIFAEHTSTLLQNSLDARRFAELSIRDNLTGLYNDRYFYDAITQEVTKSLKKKSELSLVFLDLDNFKQVNDTYGHLAGSRLLSEMGVILGSGLKGFVVIATRYGGDEFVCILPGANSETAARYAEHLRKSIEEFVFLKRRFRGMKTAIRLAGQITASIGVASVKHGTKKVTATSARDTLIREADRGMYDSKESGKNKVTVKK